MQTLDLAEAVVAWCLERWKINVPYLVVVTKYEKIKCNGRCDPMSPVDHGYYITVAGDQFLRDFIATVIHETVHLKQYVTGIWTGDGEDEAEALQYLLADIWLTKPEIKQ